jgi:hypothetical protein
LRATRRVDRPRGPGWCAPSFRLISHGSSNKTINRSDGKDGTSRDRPTKKMLSALRTARSSCARRSPSIGARPSWPDVESARLGERSRHGRQQHATRDKMARVVVQSAAGRNKTTGRATHDRPVESRHLQVEEEPAEERISSSSPTRSLVKNPIPKQIKSMATTFLLSIFLWFKPSPCPIRTGPGRPHELTNISTTGERLAGRARARELSPTC